jgi:hypothetical protein
VMHYLRSSRELPLIMEADNSQVIKWWANGSFAVHPDMKSHTGGCMTMGHGVVYGTSTWQKLNTHSSTEAELVAVYDVMLQVLWTRHFLGAQGYDVKETVMYQDNQSAILLETNSKLSSCKRTRHIHIQHFFVADCVAAGHIILKYCPTGMMLADYFTKPLQGAPFYKFCNNIMNIHEDIHAMTMRIPGVCWESMLEPKEQARNNLRKWNGQRSHNKDQK